MRDASGTAIMSQCFLRTLPEQSDSTFSVILLDFVSFWNLVDIHID